MEILPVFLIIRAEKGPRVKKQTIIDIAVPLAVSLMLGIFAAVAPAYELIKWKMYDTFLGLKSSVPEDPRLVILQIGDRTIESLRMYPLGRDFIGQGITKVSEFGASVMAIDSEFIDISPRGIEESYLKEKIPEYFTTTFQTIINNNQSLAEGMISGEIGKGFARELIPQLSEEALKAQKDLLDKVQGVIRDNDRTLGGAARFFGNVHSTVTPVDDKGVLGNVQDGSSFENIILNQVALKNVQEIEPGPFRSLDHVSATIEPILSGMRGAGSVKQVVDDDGVRRRVELLYKYKGHYYPQLGFSGLLQWLGDPKIEIYSRKIVLKQAQVPGQAKTDIEIPVDEKGYMIVHWPKKKFIESFRQVEFVELLAYDQGFEFLIGNLEQFKVFDWYYQIQADIQGLFDLFNRAEAAKKQGMVSGDPSEQVKYRNLRLQFLEKTRDWLKSETPKEILVPYENALAKLTSDSEEFKAIESEKKEIQGMFAKALQTTEDTLVQHKQLTEALTGAFVVLGYTGKSTTDIGVNPFEKEYMNVGTMAAVANTVIQQKFLQFAPWWWSFLMVLPLVFLIPWIFNKMSPGRGIALGIGGLFFLTGIFFTVFALTGIYLDALMAILVTGFTFLIAVFINFRRTNNQKAFITDAFGQYLSSDVIEELLQDPDKLKLGGEKRQMTAIFTDVKGFSTISEQMDPVDLVTLLNEYLSAMSDIILAEKGTIDKYEGDAIIAFFGAPHTLPDHAKRAARAAIKMKKTEVALNSVFLEKKMTPSLLYTRIGINTGDMVVGNMGTMRKKNYTMMGNAVNLAARLEGVNKQFQTGVLISEMTANQLDQDFILRKLDRVRVVGVSTPLRLFELIDETSLTEPYTLEKVQMFEAALELYEQRQFEAAGKGFAEVLRHTPWDGPAQIYLAKCLEYVKNPPPADWDGVNNMTSK